MKIIHQSALIAAIFFAVPCAWGQIVDDGSFTNDGVAPGNAVYTAGGGGFHGNPPTTTIGHWLFGSTQGNGKVAPLGATGGTGIILSSASTAPGEDAILQQAISVVNNAVYTLTFDYQSTTGVSLSNGGVEVLFNNIVLATLPGTSTLTSETFMFTATATESENLTFENVHADNSSKASVNLNNIVMTTTPEPRSVMAMTLFLVGVCVIERKRFGKFLRRVAVSLFPRLARPSAKMSTTRADDLTRH